MGDDDESDDADRDAGPGDDDGDGGDDDGDGGDGDCEKIENEEIGADVTLEIGSTTVTFGDWVAKEDSPGEYVGFTLTVEGSAVSYRVKAGGEVFAGSDATWIHPNGTSGPEASGISYVEVCEDGGGDDGGDDGDGEDDGGDGGDGDDGEDDGGDGDDGDDDGDHDAGTDDGGDHDAGTDDGGDGDDGGDVDVD